MNAWNWPQWVALGVLAFDLVTNISKHGESRSKYDGPAKAIEVAIWCWLLWMGGFFG